MTGNGGTGWGLQYEGRSGRTAGAQGGARRWGRPRNQIRVGCKPASESAVRSRPVQEAGGAPGPGYPGAATGGGGRSCRGSVAVLRSTCNRFSWVRARALFVRARRQKQESRYPAVSKAREWWCEMVL